MAASSAFDLTVRLWDLTTGRALHVLRGHKESANAVVFSPDGKLLASTGWDGTVRVWDADRGEQLHVFPTGNDSWSIAFSPDGTLLAGVSSRRGNGEDSIVQLWDPLSGKQLRQIKVAQAWAASLTFAPNGKTLAVLGSKMVQMFALPTGEELRRLDYGWPLAYSPDGRKLAVRGNDDLVHVIDISSGKETYAIRHENMADLRLTFSPDAHTLFRSSGTRQARLWEVASGNECLRLDGHYGMLTCGAFSPDGRTLLTGSEDTSILVYDLAGQKDARRGHISTADLEKRWSELADKDASKAYRAVWFFVTAPAQSTPFIAGKLKPVNIADPAAIQRWISDLGSDQYAIRQAAAKELEKAGPQIAPAIQAALKGNITLESRRRLEQILNTFSGVPGRELLRQIRAIVALEHIGSADAVAALETVARGAPGARETEEAKAALERLTRGKR
jgi:WD40 repeat protein